jgi:hypothetical protein
METARISTYVDGGVPGVMSTVNMSGGEEAAYSQPDIEITDVGEGKKSASQSLCERIEAQPISISKWLGQHQQTLLIVGGLYLGYRVIRK